MLRLASIVSAAASVSAVWIPDGYGNPGVCKQWVIVPESLDWYFPQFQIVDIPGCCPPVSSDGRCGPSFGGAICAQHEHWALFCSSGGWCGQSEFHKGHWDGAYDLHALDGQYSHCNKGAVESKNQLPVTSGLTSFFAPTSFDGQKWTDLAGNKHGEVTRGKVTLGFSGPEDLSNKEIMYLKGTTADGIRFPSGTIPSSFTICSMTKYEGGTRRRILDAADVGSNWLHGHWGGYVGVAHYNGWKTETNVDASVHGQDDWVVLCANNKAGGLVTFNSRRVNVNNIAGTGNRQLTVNDGSRSAERSDWGAAYIAIYNRHLSNDEMRQVEAHFMDKLGTEVGGGFDTGDNPGEDIVYTSSSGYADEPSVSCPEGYTVLDCTCYSPWQKCAGAYPNRDMKSCRAHSTGGGNFVQAKATCGKDMGPGTSGVQVWSKYTDNRDDARAWIQCPAGFAMTGCSYYAPDTHVDGAYVDTFEGALRCVAQDGNAAGSAARAVAICYKGLHANMPTSRRSAFGAFSDDALQKESCPAGSRMTGCQCFSHYDNCDGAIPTADWCAAQTGQHNGYRGVTSQIICVDFSAHPTPAPTGAPTTPAPTGAPTAAPTGAPTAAPTEQPTTAEQLRVQQLSDAMSSHLWETGKNGNDVYKCDRLDNLCFVNRAGARGKWVEFDGIPPTALTGNIQLTTDDNTTFDMGVDSIVVTEADGAIIYTAPWDCRCGAGKE